MQNTGVHPMDHDASPPQALGQHLLEPAPAVIQQVSEFPQHTFSQVGTYTSLSDLKKYIIKTNDEGNTYHRCAYPTCSDKGRFSSKRQAISHIRRVHLQEKPFMCGWYVDPECERVRLTVSTAGEGMHTPRMQDATSIRRTRAKFTNAASGEHILFWRSELMCRFTSNKRYARQDYRDKHEKRCVLKQRD
jgi:hypothetical protein